MTSLTSDEILLRRPDLLEHKDAVRKYLVMIRAQTEPVFEILTESSRDRFVIYKLCELLGLKFERVERKGVRTFCCCDFPGPWTDPETGCGCGNVPKRFKKHEGDLDYDDLYMEYNVPWVFKEGVRIFRD